MTERLTICSWNTHVSSSCDWATHELLTNYSRVLVAWCPQTVTELLTNCSQNTHVSSSRGAPRQWLSYSRAAHKILTCPRHVVPLNNGRATRELLTNYSRVLVMWCPQTVTELLTICSQTTHVSSSCGAPKQWPSSCAEVCIAAYNPPSRHTAPFQYVQIPEMLASWCICQGQGYSLRTLSIHSSKWETPRLEEPHPILVTRGGQEG